MSLFQIPDPVSIFESAKTSGMERDTLNSLLSMAYSAQISFLWSSGSSKLALWFGEGQALRDCATSIYLSLETLQKRGFLSLTVPSEMLTAANLSRFQTQFVNK